MKRKLIITTIIVTVLLGVRFLIPCSTIAAAYFLSGNMDFLEQRILLDENFRITEGVYEYEFKYSYDVPHEVVLSIPEECSLERYKSDGGIRQYHFELIGNITAGNVSVVSFSTQNDIAFVYNNYNAPDNIRFYIASFDITPMCRLYRLLGKDMKIEIKLVDVDEDLKDCTAILEIRSQHP